MLKKVKFELLVLILKCFSFISISRKDQINKMIKWARYRNDITEKDDLIDAFLSQEKRFPSTNELNKCLLDIIEFETEYKEIINPNKLSYIINLHKENTN